MQQVVPWGESIDAANDVSVRADYDGDGKYDLAFYCRSTGQWLIRSSQDGSFRTEQWGVAGDFSVPADYDARQEGEPSYPLL